MYKKCLMLKLMLIFLASISLVSCKSNKTTKNEMINFKTADINNKEDLVHQTFQNIASEIWRNQKIDLVYLSTLPTAKQVIYKTYLLEMEVNNGGFYQFYSNRGYEIAEQIPYFLGLLGAVNHSEIVKEANNLFIVNKVDDFENNNFKELDYKFYKESENEIIIELQARYILENKNDFVREN